MTSSKGNTNKIEPTNNTPKTPLKIAITGGVASGKSRAAKVLELLGVRVIDTDIISREILQPGKDGFNEVIKEFGSGFLKADGTLDRAKLRAEVFNSSEKLSKLNSITHPIITKHLRMHINECRDKIIFVQVPLLVDTGLTNEFDIVWSISASKDIRIKRLIARDNISRELAESMISAQLPESIRNNAAHIIIYNEGSIEDFDRAVKEEYLKLI